MTFGMLCARRAAILAALAGGFMVAVLGAGLCAKGVAWGGGTMIDAIRSGLDAIGL